MAYDGSITLYIDTDKKSLKNTVNTTEKAAQQIGSGFEKAGNKISNALAGGGAKSAKLVLQIQKANLEIQKQSQILEVLKSKLAGLESGEIIPDDSGIKKLQKNFDSTTESIKKTELEIERLRKLTDDLEEQAFKDPDTGIAIFDKSQEAEFQNTLNKLDELTLKLESDKQKAKELGDALKRAVGTVTQNEIDKTKMKISETENKLLSTTVKANSLDKEMSKGFSSGIKGLDNFSKRIGRLAASALVFTVITKALNNLKELFGNALMANEEFKKSINNLKAALTVIATPLYNIIMPALKALINYITALIMGLVRLYSQFSGKSVDSLIANAKALKKQSDAYKKTGDSAKKASRGIAAFDEVNTLSSNDNTGTSDKLSDGEFTEASIDPTLLTSNVSATMAEVMAIVSGSLLALGVILLCMGQIPWGLGLILIGIVGLYTAMTASGDETTNQIQRTISIITAIAGGALLALGIILLAFGQIPIGIALLAVGALLLVAAYTANKNKITEDVKRTISIIMAIAGAAFLVLGIILVCCGIIPTGIALIAAGAISLISVIAMNKNAILDWIKGVWNSIKEFWNKYIAPWFTVKKWKELAGNIGTGLKNGFIAAINGIITLFEKGVNFIIKMLNKLSFDVPDWVPGLGGKKFGFDLQPLKIPRLAQGAVLPANRPFLAQLGDQKNGRNLEAPENLLRQIYAEENAPMIAILQQMLEVLKKGTSVQIDGREVMIATRNAESRAGRQTVTGGFANAY